MPGVAALQRHAEQFVVGARCWKGQSVGAHHQLPKGHPLRYLWLFMRALCIRCHVAVHRSQRPVKLTLVIRLSR